MLSTYKEKLIQEIETIPDEMIPQFYRIINVLKNEIVNKPQPVNDKQTLRGIWRGSKIKNNLIKQAKDSVFSYENSSDRL